MMGTFIACIYSIITTLPLFFLLSSTFKAVLITIGFLIPLIFIYRSFIHVHIYDFEYSGSSVPSIIFIFLSIISCIISFFLLDGTFLFLLRAIPIFVVFYFTYIFVVYDFILNYDDQTVFKVKHNHLKFTDRTIQFYMILKIILLVGLSINSMDTGHTILWILSFIFDLIIIIDKRKNIYYMRLYQNGFKQIYKKVNYNKWTFIIILLSLFIAIALGKNSAIFPYTIITAFINGLFLSKAPIMPDEYFGSSALGHKSDNSFKKFIDENSNPVQLSPWLEQFLNLILNLVLIGSVIFILYLLLYPLISPLFKKRGGKVTFKEYYRQLIERIREFFLSIFKMDKSYEKTVIHGIHKHQTTLKVISIKKRREVNTLLRYYIKLIKWNKTYANNRLTDFTVNEFFIMMKSNNTAAIQSLNRNFNIGFYSEELIGSEKVSEIKKLVKEVIKNRT